MSNVVKLETEKKVSKTQLAKEVLNFLNYKTGRNYRETEVNLNFIRARLIEGYTLEECRAVIAMKVRDWQYNDKMRPYLRPATLFNCEKFNQYAGCLEEED